MTTRKTTLKKKIKWKKGKYRYITLDSGRRKRFGLHSHPSYEYSDWEEDLF